MLHFGCGVKLSQIYHVKKTNVIFIFVYVGNTTIDFPPCNHTVSHLTTGTHPDYIIRIYVARKMIHFYASFSECAQSLDEFIQKLSHLCRFHRANHPKHRVSVFACTKCDYICRWIKRFRLLNIWLTLRQQQWSRQKPCHYCIIYDIRHTYANDNSGS